eukprot:794106_1
MKFTFLSLLFLVTSSSAFSMTTPKSFLAEIPMGAPDAILGIAENFKACTDPNKVNVCVGAYRDENGKPWILPSVREAEKLMIDDAAETKEYASIAGDAAYVAEAVKFAYGQDMDLSSLAAVQSLSGTGACRIGGNFLAKFAPVKKIYIPDPTWGNHIAIFEEAGLEVVRYRYYSRATNGLDLDGMLE